MSNIYVPFKDRSEWNDVTPIEQDDGPNPVVPIAYTDKFRDTMNYFRAVLKNNEISERALALTDEVINLNAANYTAWYYRRDLKEEMEYTDAMTEENQKNYQVWYHRQAILEKSRDVGSELELVARIISEDSKNYHAWVHRQWVVKEFNLWSGELQYLDGLIKDDVRNNSAWNHRFFVISHLDPSLSDKTRLEEIKYAFTSINLAPNNESPWNYAKGVASAKGGSDAAYQALKEGAEALLKRAPVNPFGHYVLLDCCTRSGTNQDLERGIVLCDNLVKFDGIRKKYWEFRKQKLSKDLAH
ncbi:farnesyltransferase/geranylgeranyltransferase type-1 subunit alpha [Acrasis kona]|uniref:Protein farnesyltransferase/geranylgeranyltransferase type-1 subunit alpha n=1 Tax=Acrasis kona TaxID=1008807 RepID=A0AAW2ZBQ7_9EUKA